LQRKLADSEGELAKSKNRANELQETLKERNSEADVMEKALVVTRAESLNLKDKNRNLEERMKDMAATGRVVAGRVTVGLTVVGVHILWQYFSQISNPTPQDTSDAERALMESNMPNMSLPLSAVAAVVNESAATLASAVNKSAVIFAAAAYQAAQDLLQNLTTNLSAAANASENNADLSEEEDESAEVKDSEKIYFESKEIISALKEITSLRDQGKIEEVILEYNNVLISNPGIKNYALIYVYNELAIAHSLKSNIFSDSNNLCEAENSIHEAIKYYEKAFIVIPMEMVKKGIFNYIFINFMRLIKNVPYFINRSHLDQFTRFSENFKPEDMLEFYSSILNTLTDKIKELPIDIDKVPQLVSVYFQTAATFLSFSAQQNSLTAEWEKMIDVIRNDLNELDDAQPLQTALKKQVATLKEIGLSLTERQNKNILELLRLTKQHLPETQGWLVDIGNDISDYPAHIFRCSKLLEDTPSFPNHIARGLQEQPRPKAPGRFGVFDQQHNAKGASAEKKKGQPPSADNPKTPAPI
jgi:tetratricopeptide (TPR) repeat protein